MIYGEKLHMLQSQVVRKKHIETLLNDLYKQKRELDSKVAALRNERNNEQDDVERLERRTLTAFFLEIVGKKEEKLDKERREAYAAAAKYDAAVREYEAVMDDIAHYENELQMLTECEENYRKALEEKAKIIKTSNTPEAAQILHLEEKIAYLDSQKKEIIEAISAGKTAKSMTEDVLDKLESAEGWGTWDALGGGIISDIAKHSALDEAQAKIEQLQIQLRRFKTELADVTIHADVQVSIDGFLRFADYFFDGIFVDWTVLDKIRDSKEKVRATKKKIEDILQKLSSMRYDIDNESKQLKAELDEKIVRARTS